MAAFYVDGACLGALWFLAGAFWVSWLTQASTQAITRDPLLGILSVLVIWCLFACKDGFRGFSPGKWLLGLRVLDARTREPAGFRASFKRNIPLVLPIVNWIAILVIAGQIGRGPRLGDGWAKTMVIWQAHANKLPFNPYGLVCYQCGYDLRGNVSGICPECGTPVGGSTDRPIGAHD